MCSKRKMKKKRILSCAQQHTRKYTREQCRRRSWRAQIMYLSTYLLCSQTRPLLLDLPLSLLCYAWLLRQMLDRSKNNALNWIYHCEYCDSTHNIASDPQWTEPSISTIDSDCWQKMINLVSKKSQITGAVYCKTLLISANTFSYNFFIFKLTSTPLSE